MNLIAGDVCRQPDYYASLISDNMFCAGRTDWSRDACEVFSTSPDWAFAHRIESSGFL